MDFITQTHHTNDSATSTARLKSILTRLGCNLDVLVVFDTLAVNAQLAVPNLMQATDEYTSSDALFLTGMVN